MSRRVDPGVPKHPPSAVPKLDRRRFLARLGLLAGGAALAPLLKTRRSDTGAIHRLEAGRPALGTWMRVVVRHPDRQAARSAVEDAFAAVRRVDAQMSVHRADSQLSQVNAAAGRAAAPVDVALLDVVSMACEASVRSGGVYDPTVLPLMRLYGFYGAGRAAPPRDREWMPVLARMGTGEVTVDRAAHAWHCAARARGSTWARSARAGRSIVRCTRSAARAYARRSSTWAATSTGSERPRTTRTAGRSACSHPGDRARSTACSCSATPPSRPAGTPSSTASSTTFA